MSDTCRLCRAPIVTHVSIGGRVLDLDPTPGPDGNIVVTVHEGRTRARILTGDEMPADEPAYRRHRCPTSRPAPGPLCPTCQTPMPRELAALERWTTHPCCEPSYLRELARQGLVKA